MFVKTGDSVPIQAVMCSCGGEIDQDTMKCKKCGKDFKESSNNDSEKEQNNAD